MKIINPSQSNKNPALSEIVEPENDLKNMLVEYVGESLNPDNKDVTVEMIVEVVAKEFPEFMLVIAEENWVRGYQQGIQDIHSTTDKLEEYSKKIVENEKRRTCKLCDEEK